MLTSPPQVALCRRYPHAFAAYLFREIHGGELSDAPYIYILAEIVRGCAKHGRQIVNAPPSSLISWMCVTVHAAFHLGRHPSSTVEIVFGDRVMVDEAALQVRQILATASFHAVFPRARMLPMHFGKQDIETTKGGRITFRTLREAQVGPMVDRMIFDTPQAEDNLASQAARDLSFGLFQNASSRLEPKGSLLITTHRLHGDDVTGRLAKSGDYVVWPFPLISEQFMQYNLGEHGIKRSPGNVLDPAVWTPAMIDRLKRELPAATFATQFQQMPT